MTKRIVILGSGESGTGAALLAKQNGFDVFVSDLNQIPEQYITELKKHEILFEQNKHSLEKIFLADEVIKSPGIPDNIKLIIDIKAKGIPVISEIEFASRYTQSFIIGITGTNGKTTTASLVYHLLQKAGFDVALGGNIGKSFARLVADKNYAYYVLELSSFQLDGIINFRPNISVITNITPDHLDRYNYELQHYVASKFLISKNQNEDDLLIYCADDTITVQNLQMASSLPRKWAFGYHKSVDVNTCVEDGEIISTNLKNKSNPFNMRISELTLKGKHNAYNSMVAAIVGQALNIRNDVIRESLMDFQNVEHRLETLGTIRGVEFFNDSKATNVNSAWYALESMDKPVIWIAGGVDKGNDYSILEDLVKEKVRILVCLGLDNHKIHNAFSKHVDLIVNTSSAAEAVHVAFQLSKPGEVVLLSPACASFDLFKNYEERGRQFKMAVKNL